MRWAAPWVGRQFDAAGFNCWHLVREVYRARTGIELPAYGDTDARDMANVVRSYRGRLAEPWVKVDTPGPLDVVVMAGRGRVGRVMHRTPMHAGVMVDSWRVLHLEEGTDSVLVPLTHASVRFRVLGFYRHKDLQ